MAPPALVRPALARHADDRVIASAAPARRGRWQRSVIALAAIELVLLYGPTLQWLWARWTESVWEQAHGLLIVPVVGYVVWQELRSQVKRPPAPSAWGFAFLVPGLALHVLDMGMHTQLLSAASLVLVLPGLFLLVLGTGTTRAVAFPLSLLVLALPIPLGFTEQIHWQLRLLVTAALGSILPLLGIPTFTEGTRVLLAGGSLEIADACSGFTTLYAAIAVALLTAYTATSGRRRALVLVSAIPLAIAANVLRVVALAVLVVWRGSDILDTFVHPLSGMMTFALALPIIFWLGGDLRSPASRDEARA